MAATKQLILNALQNLTSNNLSNLIWHLKNPIGNAETGPIEAILEVKLQNADYNKVVDVMVEEYSENAGTIAVKMLRDIKQNDLASKLDKNLRKASVQPSDEVDRPIVYHVDTGIVNNPGYVRQQQLIQFTWNRPEMIIPCSQEFKDKLLRENKDIYVPRNKSLRKRMALLITNTHNRNGALRDEENMVWLLTTLGYGVMKYRDLSGEEIDNAVRNFVAFPEHEDSDSTFVVIMSHGEKVDNKDAIIGAYNTGPNDHFFVEKVFSHLNSQNCPALNNKPKVIIIQACRGEESGGVEMSDIVSDYIGGAWKHKEKDFVCFMSSLPNVQAYRRSDIGSYFICYILQEFCEWAHKEHIMDLFLKVTSDMAEQPELQEKKLLPCIERMSLTKKFYLFPGL